MYCMAFPGWLLPPVLGNIAQAVSLFNIEVRAGERQAPARTRDGPRAGGVRWDHLKTQPTMLIHGCACPGEYLVRGYSSRLSCAGECRRWAAISNFCPACYRNRRSGMISPSVIWVVGGNHARWSHP